MTAHVSDSISVHHQESSTVHTAIGICHTGYADCLLTSITCVTYTYCVYSARLLMMDRDTVRNMCSHIPKINFRKLVLLVGFVIRIYHDRITGILDKINEYRRNWLSHLQRMPQNRIPLKSYHYRQQGRRTIGRPKKRWCEQL